MELLKASISSISILTITICIVEMLLPSNSYRKQIGLITGAVLVLTMIIPLCCLSGVSIPQIDYELVDSDISASLEKAAAEAMKNEISAELENMKINNAKIRVFTNINSDRCIIINKAEVCVDNEQIEATKKAMQTLEAELKIPIAVKIQ